MTEGDEGFVWPNGKDRVFKPRAPSRFVDRPENAHSKQVDDDAEALFAYFEGLWKDECYRSGWFYASKILGSALTADEDAFHVLAGDFVHPTMSGIQLPMLYCCRHYIEVSLKHLITELQPLSHLDCDVKLGVEHRLNALWDETNRHWIAIFSEADHDNTGRQVERLINEFHQRDPESFAFRYRDNKNGPPHEMPDFDSNELMRTMLALRNCFEGMGDAVCHAREEGADV